MLKSCLKLELHIICGVFLLPYAPNRQPGARSRAGWLYYLYAPHLDVRHRQRRYPRSHVPAFFSPLSKLFSPPRSSCICPVSFQHVTASATRRCTRITEAGIFYTGAGYLITELWHLCDEGAWRIGLNGFRAWRWHRLIPSVLCMLALTGSIERENVPR